MKNNTSVIRKTLYPKVEAFLNSPTGKKAFVKLMGEFISVRSEALFSALPCDRIAFTTKDKDDLLSTFQMTNKEIKNIINNTYYADIKKFNFVIPQDPISVLMLCIVRYFMMNPDEKLLDLALVYITFSGKFYASAHYKSFPIPPKEYVMEYVVNNAMNNRFDIVKTKSVFNLMKLKAQIWKNTYKSKFKDFDDDDAVYLLLQLKARIVMTIRQIAKEYYKAYKNKDYIVYNSDNEDTDNPNEYHISNSDSFLAEKCIDTTMSAIASGGTSYKLCKLCSNKTVKTDELKMIIESILNNPDNIPEIRDVISTMIYTYFQSTRGEKTVLTMDFITYASSAKPNTKDEHWLRLKETITKWLETSSALYRKRKHRMATRNDYHRAMCMYFSMMVYTANK